MSVTGRLRALHAPLGCLHARQARAALCSRIDATDGLSYGTYLASVIDGTPAPGGLGEAVRALNASTAQLAALSTDLNDYVRLLRRLNFAEAEKYRQRVVSMFDEVRQHVRLNAALSAEVRAVVRWKPQEPNPS